MNFFIFIELTLSAAGPRNAATAQGPKLLAASKATNAKFDKWAKSKLKTF
jgi:hypothetical protein